MINFFKKTLSHNPYIRKIAFYVYIKTYGLYLKKKANKRLHEKGELVLEQLDLVFKKLKLDYWLEFGTLLGAIRDKNFIKHDLDIDIGTYITSHSDKSEKIFNQFGFKKIKSYTINKGINGREERYSYLGVSVDIFYFTKESHDRSYCHIFVPHQKRKGSEPEFFLPKQYSLTIKSIEKILFLGKEYPAPSPARQHLIDIYGDDYLIENPSWVTTEEINSNVKILTDEIGIVERYN